MTWKKVDSAPRKHGFRFLAWNADIGFFSAEWFRGKGYVYSWNQDPCGFTHWKIINEPNRSKGISHKGGSDA